VGYLQSVWAATHTRAPKPSPRDPSCIRITWLPYTNSWTCRHDAWTAWICELYVCSKTASRSFHPHISDYISPVGILLRNQEHCRRLARIRDQERAISETAQITQTSIDFMHFKALRASLIPNPKPQPYTLNPKPDPRVSWAHCVLTRLEKSWARHVRCSATLERRASEVCWRGHLPGA